MCEQAIRAEWPEKKVETALRNVWILFDANDGLFGLCGDQLCQVDTVKDSYGHISRDVKVSKHL